MTDSIEGSGPVQLWGFPSQLRQTKAEGWLAACVTRFEKSEWEEIKRRKDPAKEGGWEGTPQLSRVREPSEDWKRGVFRTPPPSPEHDSMQVWGRNYSKWTPKKNRIYKESRADLFRLYARVKRAWLRKLIWELRHLLFLLCDLEGHKCNRWGRINTI